MNTNNQTTTIKITWDTKFQLKDLQNKNRFRTMEDLLIAMLSEFRGKEQ